MPHEPNHEHTELARRLRRALRLEELTLEQAQAEYDAAVPVELLDTKIHALVEGAFAQHQQFNDLPFEIHEWTPETDTSEIESDVYQLNRNEGEPEAEVEDLIEKHRREALGEDTSGDDSQDHPEDETSD